MHENYIRTALILYYTFFVLSRVLRKKIQLILCNMIFVVKTVLKSVSFGTISVWCRNKKSANFFRGDYPSNVSGIKGIFINWIV